MFKTLVQTHPRDKRIDINVYYTFKLCTICFKLLQDRGEGVEMEICSPVHTYEYDEIYARRNVAPFYMAFNVSEALMRLQKASFIRGVLQSH